MVPWDFSLENELHVTEEKVSDNTIYFCLAFLLIYGSAPSYIIALQVACFVLKIRILSVLKFLFHLIKSIWFTLVASVAIISYLFILLESQKTIAAACMLLLYFLCCCSSRLLCTMSIILTRDPTVFLSDWKIWWVNIFSISLFYLCL